MYAIIINILFNYFYFSLLVGFFLRQKHSGFSFGMHVIYTHEQFSLLLSICLR